MAENNYIEGRLLDGFLLLAAGGSNTPDEVITVNLSSLQIVDIAEEDLAFFAQLHRVDLSDNQLGYEHLLEQIARIPRLGTLNLACNSISSLQVGHGILQFLEVLDLSFNGLHGDVLGQLARLPNLVWLNLASNCISSLPPEEELSGLQVLQELILDSNDLVQFMQWRSLDAVPQLRKLSLVSNRVKRLKDDAPDTASGTTISYFPTLEELDLSYNEITGVSSLPVIQWFQSLKVLHLTENPCSRSPADFSNVEVVREEIKPFYMKGNGAFAKLEKIPKPKLKMDGRKMRKVSNMKQFGTFNRPRSMSQLGQLDEETNALVVKLSGDIMEMNARAVPSAPGKAEPAGLINAGNWSFNDEEVFVLRKRILRAYRQLEAKKSTHAPEFKVYVYDEEEVPQLKPLLRSQIYCSRGQWGTDVQVHDYFFASDLQTDDPDEADFFFVPGYAICVLEGNLYSLDEVDELYKDLVTALPYFNASGGRDHIFVFGSGMAQSVFQSWEEYIPQSIVLTPETELFNDFAWVAIPPYRPFKDIVIPGSLDLIEVIAALEKSKPLHERRFLSAFFGRADVARGPHPWVGGVDVRKELLALRELPGTEDMKFGDGATLEVMHEAYGDAKFCFVPRGKSGWSLRFFEVIFAGCIPVMISDKWELPFEDFLDVTRFVIKWPSTQIGPQLIAYLRSLPDSTVQEYMDEAKKIRCWYFYPPKKLDVRSHLQRQHGVCPEGMGQDAFRGIRRILRRRRRKSRTSTKAFYFKDATGQLRYVDTDLRALQ